MAAANQSDYQLQQLRAEAETLAQDVQAFEQRERAGFAPTKPAGAIAPALFGAALALVAVAAGALLWQH